MATSQQAAPRAGVCARGLSTVAMAVALAFAQPAAADNLVVNGGFETGDFTGWVDLNGLDSSGVDCPGPNPDPPLLDPAEGDCYGFFGPVGHLGTLAQGINTVPGQRYVVEFSYAADGQVPSAFVATFAGVPLLSLSDLPDTGGFVTRVFHDIVATDISETLSFDFQNDSGFLYLDRVIVAAVPEPATLALAGIALAALAVRRRRR